MAGVLKQREERREEVTVLPHIERVERLHHPIETLSRSADHFHIPAEGVYATSPQADFAHTVLRNRASLGLDSTSVPSGFARMLESI
jgi:hypothetical protein